jgi:clan AA aspartic protease
MGLTFIEGIVQGPTGQKNSVKFLVDSGAIYTLLAKEYWKNIGLESTRKMDFTLADGTIITREISECLIILPQGTGHTPVILGQEGDESLLGAVTLEILGLKLNPFQRTLEPMRMMLV